ncbi:type-F conjugative transfer system secretin TraK [Janthinobacterium sp. PSPC3-1]|uniref:type-F conjugative transfer system secretin TraK n=1 Tax=Janthinobacterium sp. PSPC3-1 TaxID=2804653 RepID=UPI003CFB44B5
MKIRILSLMWLSLACVELPAGAVQTREVRDGATIEAVISAREPTRIRIDGEKIVDVVGNMYSSSNCLAKPVEAATQVQQAGTASINPSGQFTLACNLARGEIYLQPIGTAPVVNLFVSSNTATYSLRLSRADVPADTIVIVDKSPRRTSGQAGAPLPAAARSASYVRSLKAMLIAMAADRPPADIQMETRDDPQLLWAEAEMKLVRLFTGRGLTGETYLLKNISSAPLVLAEQEFDREDGNVLAVAIEHLNLRPHDSTRVYVIRSGE